MGLVAVSHPKQAQTANAILILSPEHYGIFRARRLGPDAHYERDCTRRSSAPAAILSRARRESEKALRRKPGRRDGSEILG